MGAGALFERRRDVDQNVVVRAMITSDELDYLLPFGERLCNANGGEDSVRPRYRESDLLCGRNVVRYLLGDLDLLLQDSSVPNVRDLYLRSYGVHDFGVAMSENQRPESKVIIDVLVSVCVPSVGACTFGEGNHGRFGLPLRIEYATGRYGTGPTEK